MVDANLVTESVQLLIPMYIDSAKTYLELSVGALALTIVFREKVMGDVDQIKVNLTIAISWFLFLIAIGASAYYQWVAVKLVEYHVLGVKQFPLTISWLWPRYAYGLMVCGFFLGASLVVLSSIYRLKTKKWSV